jgi:hypothetical protein
MTFYIGAPIDTSNTDIMEPYDKLTALIKAASIKLNHPEYVIFNPFSAYRHAHTAMGAGLDYVVDTNNFALDNASIAVFIVNDQPSIGVPYEIARRAEQKRPLFVWYRGSKSPGIYLKWLLRSNDVKRSKLTTETDETALIAELADFINKNLI